MGPSRRHGETHLRARRAHATRVGPLVPCTGCTGTMAHAAEPSHYGFGVERPLFLPLVCYHLGSKGLGPLTCLDLWAFNGGRKISIYGQG
jgi:hypothetical protein